MGSGLCSQEWVANRLGVTTKSVRNYVKRGLLKQQTQNGHPAYDRDEVEQIALERGTDFPVMNRRAFIEMQMRIKKLEQDMGVLRRARDMQDNPWRPDSFEARTIYKLAVDSLGPGDWPLEEMEEWSKIFDRMDETSLVKVREATLQEHPWDPFFRLCVNMQLRLASKADFKTSLPLQEMHKKLEEGRRKLRGTIIVWAELNTDSPVQGVLKEMENPHEGVLKRLKSNSR